MNRFIKFYQIKKKKENNDHYLSNTFKVYWKTFQIILHIFQKEKRQFHSKTAQVYNCIQGGKKTMEKHVIHSLLNLKLKSLSIHLLIRLCQGYKLPKQIELFVWSSAPVNRYEKQRSRKINMYSKHKKQENSISFPKKSVLKICPKLQAYICPFWSLQWHVTIKGGHSLSALTTICSYKLRKRKSHSHKHRSQVVGSQMLSTFKCFPALYSYKAYSFLTPWLNKKFTSLYQMNMKLNWTAPSYKLLIGTSNLSLLTQ